MSKTLLNQGGADSPRRAWMTATVIVLAVVAAASVALSIYFAQQNPQLSADITTKNNQIADLQKQVNTPAKTTPSTTTQTTQSNVVKISAWGIQFQEVASLADTQVKYYARTSSDNPPQDYYGFSTARVEALGTSCTTLPLSDIVILHRYTDKPVATPDGTLLNSAPIGGYYYVATAPIAPCKAGSAVEDQDYAALNESLKSISVIN